MSGMRSKFIVRALDRDGVSEVTMLVTDDLRVAIREVNALRRNAGSRTNKYIIVAAE